jgi:hypothetical protein
VRGIDAGDDVLTAAGADDEAAGFDAELDRDGA